MISIRHFTEHDAIIIQQKQYTETSINRNDERKQIHISSDIVEV